MFLERVGAAYAATSFLSLQNEPTDSGGGESGGGKTLGVSGSLSKLGNLKYGIGGDPPRT